MFSHSFLIISILNIGFKTFFSICFITSDDFHISRMEVAIEKVSVGKDSANAF